MNPEPIPARAAGSPTLRRAGIVALVLAVLALLGAVTGWNAHGSTGRLVLAAVGVVLLLTAITLVRSHDTGVLQAFADANGLTFRLSADGQDSVPWTEVRAVRLLSNSGVHQGYVLSVDGDEWLAQRHPELSALTCTNTTGGATATAGVSESTGRQLAAQLPRFAGERYRPGPRVGS